MNLRDPNVQKGIAGIALVIVLVWLVFLSNYLPFSYPRTAARVESLREELQVVAGDLQRLESAVRNLPRVRSEVKTLTERWEVLRGILPKESEMSALLSGVTTAGMRAGVQFTLFEPGQPEPYDLYTRHPIRVGVTGSYHQVGRFLENVCNMERLVGISNMSVNQISEGEEMVTVEAEATIAAFTYSEKQEETDTKKNDRDGKQ
jgi:type IV pilus assembly protein PilO